MSIKTNKSYLKRLKITKSGKILARKAGQNHFNAKERTRVSGRKSGFMTIKMDNKSRSRFLATQ
jgi:ribosomal protein L35